MKSNKFFEQWKLVDLSHSLSEDIPIFPDDPTILVEKWSTVEEHGYMLNRISVGEHTGTHFGAPAHFLPTGRTLEKYKADELIVAASVINVVNKVKEQPDYGLTVNDVLDWERENGVIPEGHLVIMFTSWSQRWSNPEKYLGLDKDQLPHYPGFTLEAVKFLINERRIVGLGIDTHGIDRGCDQEFEANKYLFEASCFHLENLNNIEKLHPTESILFIGVNSIKGGSGSPARVFGIIPR